MPVDPAREKSLILAASDLADPAERAAYLDRECGADIELRARVEALLRADAGPAPDTTAAFDPSLATGDFAPDGATGTFGDTPARPERSATTTLGTVIAGRYTLVEVIGEGGMGSVYLASQTEPVKRRVALKLIKPGMDSKAVLARFDAERQALALMDHPNIARIYDGGVTAAGQPFFVMELVQGVSLTEYCDSHRLTVDARLQLFVAVCQAVQHAHQKGIIHRDLKPSNVLVAEVDGRPTPKVIDFGVAKATEQKLTDQSFSDTGAIVGTPAYMSPEQADPSSMDIDTRTDVYALGVILYELLTGSPPIDGKQFKRGAILEMLRMVREVEPPRPSTKLSTTDALPKIAANRNIEPGKLAKLLQGELDWVVMKALEKDRTRRYETANGLARDIQRYLSDEVVEARPPSRGYRLKKFVCRYRVAVTAGTAVAAALLIGIVGFAWQAKIARDQRDRAVYAEGQTQKRADEVQKVSDYQAKMLQQIDPTEAGTRLMADLRARHGTALERAKVPEAERSARAAAFERELHAVNATDTAVALLDRAVLAPSVRAIDAQFADQPLVDATLRTTLGLVYDSLGRPAKALELYRRAHALRAASLGEDHQETLKSRSGVGKALGALQQHDEAEGTLRETLKAVQRTLGDDHEDTLAAMDLLALELHNQGKYEESETLYRAALERCRGVLPADHEITLRLMKDMGGCLLERGKYADAETILREVIDSQRRLTDSRVAYSLTNLGVALHRQRKYAVAEPFMREALERSRREKGEDHPSTITNISNLAALFMDLGKFDEAESLAREALEKCRRVHGNEHANTLKAMNVMGQVLFNQGKPTETEPYYREALETGRRVLGEEHPDTIVWISNMGTLLRQLGRTAEAEPYLREALAKNRRVRGEAHPYTLSMTRNLADLLREQDKPAEAEVLLRGVLGKVQGKSPTETLTLMASLGNVLRDQGKLTEAEPYVRDVMEKSRRLYGDDHATTLVAILRMASLRVAQGENAEAVALLTPLDGKVTKAIPGTTGVLRQASLLGLLGKARGGLAKQPADFAVAEANLLEAHATFTKLRGEKDKETREWAQGLVDFYTARDKAVPGVGYDVKAAAWKAKLPKETAPPSREKK
jgi:eukaryotic-like serine/threonine-protein kinase